MLKLYLPKISKIFVSVIFVLSLTVFLLLPTIFLNAFIDIDDGFVLDDIGEKQNTNLIQDFYNLEILDLGIIKALA